MLAPWLLSFAEQVFENRKNGRLHHALLFYGTKGVGKAPLSQQISAQLLCSADLYLTPCGNCQSCTLFSAGNHPDLLIIDGAEKSIGVDEVRAITEFINKTSQLKNNKVVRIINAEKMSESAANALLKNLEEPSAKVYLILTSSDISQLSATITSRCTKHRINITDKANAIEWIKSQVNTANYNVTELLALSGDAPYKVIDWAEQGRIELIYQIIEHIKHWLNGSESNEKLLTLLAQLPDGVTILMNQLSLYFYQRLTEQHNQTQELANESCYFESFSSIIEQCLQFVRNEQHAVGLNHNMQLRSLLYKIERTLCRE
ncbi:DNA polymerase III subunit delta' [Flocculibacter collagenilyticus]|uniref:DNA polymerase III subunit delta' n=1 Tax=Flocculibacter collagenilyticus TaxID=2744479 RepID=UPI0018F6E0AE|nr:DNA polymerase III subunit delta' [Flocculibacter collagenilyticus]